MPPQTLVSGASLNLPRLPSIPQVTDAKTGLTVPQQQDPAGIASKAFVQQSLAAIPGTYDAQKASAGARVGQELAGYGGYATDAAGNLTYDATKAGTGQLETDAVKDQRNQANASGTLYSSFTDTGISQALNRLSLTAQGVVNQYADQLAGYLGTASTNATNLYGQWADLTGKDAAFQMANPPLGTVAPTPQDASVNTPGAANQIAANAGLPTSGPQYTNALAQRYGGIYGAAGSDPKQQQNVIAAWLKAHYGAQTPALVKRAQSDPGYAANIYNRAVGGTTR